MSAWQVGNPFPRLALPILNYTLWAICGLAANSLASPYTSATKFTSEPLPPLVVLSRCKDAPKPEHVKRLEAHLRNGGALLLGIDGVTTETAHDWHVFLPSHAWRAWGIIGQRTQARLGEVDPTLFPQELGTPLLEATYYNVSPRLAVERGMMRYEQLTRTKFDNAAFPIWNAGDAVWTRSLLNRDWQVRLRMADGEQSPLLVTGKYGAGRVALVGTKLSALDAWDQKTPIWKPLVDWLLEPRTTEQPKVEVSGQAKHDGRSRFVSLQLKGPAKQSLECLARFSTWENIHVSDTNHPVTFDATGLLQLRLPLPAASVRQATKVRDGWKVRIGVFQRGGSQLAWQTDLAVECRSNWQVDLRSEDLDVRPYPYASAPQPSDVACFQARMAAGTNSYAYKPGSKLQLKARPAIKIRPFESHVLTISGTTPRGIAQATEAFLAQGLVCGVVAKSTDRPQETLLQRPALTPDFKLPKWLPDKLGKAQCVGCIACGDDEFRSVEEDCGSSPEEMLRVKYLAPELWAGEGAGKSIDHYMASLHRRSYGHALLVIRWKDAETAAKSAAAMAKVANLTTNDSRTWQGLQSNLSWTTEGGPLLLTRHGQWTVLSTLDGQQNKELAAALQR
jgi:hypothetical protein